jgi:hypothetical protein
MSYLTIFIVALNNNIIMQYMISLLVFCIILFLYIHVYFHLKKCNDLEVLVLDNEPSKEKFEEVCNLRQPVLFDFYEEDIERSCNLSYVSSNYGAFDIHVRNTHDNKSNLTHLPMTLQSCINLMNSDKESKVLSEKNQPFLEETSMIKTMKYNDMFLRPYMVSNCYYDYMFGSNGVRTPLSYNLNFRNFYYANEGTFKVMLIPPKFSKYLYGIKDYENFHFYSPVNPWDVQAKYRADFSKIKTLEISVTKGQALYIPAYWWYSIQYSSKCSISVFQYRTYMNNVAISPHLGMRLLQSQNVKREMVKTKPIDELKKSTTESPAEHIQQHDTIDEIIENKNNTKSEGEKTI